MVNWLEEILRVTNNFVMLKKNYYHTFYDKSYDSMISLSDNKVIDYNVLKLNSFFSMQFTPFFYSLAMQTKGV